MSITTEPTEIEIEPTEVDFDEPLRPPDPVTEVRERAWHEWMGIAVALVGIVSIAAMIVSLVALGSSSKNTVQVITAAGSSGGTVAAPPIATQSFTMGIKADVEHGRRGPDGQWHDAFLPASLTVRAGDRVTITFTNYDSGVHSFVSPGLGVSQPINGGGSLGAPQTTTLTFIAPKHPGRYAWWCGTPCDPWAMKHAGYMRGYVTVKA